MRSFLLLLLLLLPAVSQACSCMNQRLEQSVANASMIYIGKLHSATLTAYNKEDGWPGIKGLFEVTTPLKGNPASIEQIYTGLGSGDCGIPMTVGRTYAIFIDNTDSVVSICGASAEISNFKQQDYIRRVKELVKKPASSE